MQYDSRHFYERYRKEGGRVPYRTFKAVLSDFNELAVEHMLEGYSFPMGSSLSRLLVVRIPRAFKKQSIDWKESNKAKAALLEAGKVPKDKQHPEGEEWLIFFTNDYYCRYRWIKRLSEVPNHSYYRFEPTRGKVGNKGKLYRLLMRDPLAHLRFKID